MQTGLVAVGTPPDGGPTAQTSCPWRVEGAGFAVLVVAGAVLLLPQLAIARLFWRFEPVTPLLDMPIGLFVALQVSAGAVYLAVSLLPKRTRDRRALLIVIAAVGLLLRAAAWPSQPILEDDFHRYLWDGATSSAGVSPYRFAPAEILGGDAAVPERSAARPRGRRQDPLGDRQKCRAAIPIRSGAGRVEIREELGASRSIVGSPTGFLCGTAGRARRPWSTPRGAPAGLWLA